MSPIQGGASPASRLISRGAAAAPDVPPPTPAPAPALRERAPAPAPFPAPAPAPAPAPEPFLEEPERPVFVLSPQTEPPMYIETIAKWAGTATTATLLTAILVAGQMGYWVTGSIYAELRKERDEWKSVALKILTKDEKASSPFHFDGMGARPERPPPRTPAEALARAGIE